MAEINEYRQNLQPLIISEAERLFRQKGIKGVTMEEIAKNLHISKRTIYELYVNKEEILLEVLQQVFKRRRQHLENFYQKPDTGTMDILIEVFRIQLESSVTTAADFYRDIKKYPKAEALLQQYSDANRDASHDFFAKGVVEGDFLPTIDYSVFIRIISAIEYAIKHSILLGGLTYQDLLNNYVRVLIRGICTQQGLVKFDKFLEQNHT